ncbi:proliferating cell nuclear antigen (pcna) [Candidatus Pacearchaeota archaeon]|nr:proliferating cell nuclear antigen (pcna) [Candidatus Pacearchaeota archaeon]|tara:strand:+ start:2970 stop:3716 length:747 start_codon:yes stop_codon:yes gene_type:complete
MNKTMRLQLQNPKIFADIIGIISDLVTEVKLKVDSNGLYLNAIDPANVAMTYFKLPSDLFSEFNIEGDKTENLGVNLENLKAVLRRCKPGSTLILEKESSFLKLTIQDRVKREFSLALIEIEAEEKTMPEWEFNSVIKIPSESLVETIEDCLIVSDACTLIASPNSFIVQASGLNSTRSEFNSDEVEIHSGNSTSRYSLEYLNKFIKGAKISSKATLSFSDGHPMRLDFATGNVILSFVLAPRVEQDD